MLKRPYAVQRFIKGNFRDGKEHRGSFALAKAERHPHEDRDEKIKDEHKSGDAPERKKGKEKQERRERNRFGYPPSAPFKDGVRRPGEDERRNDEHPPEVSHPPGGPHR